jgi:glycosyltransferase involved in cell wall biosynthesis
MRIGVGIQNKVLEAMAMGLPVVATPLAARAFDRGASANILRIGSDAVDLAQHCAEMLTNDAAALRLGQAGRDYVGEYHRWESAAETLVVQYRSALSR